MNVLFLSHRLPYAPNRGDRVRAFHMLREMSRWADIDVAALAHDADEASHAGDLAGVVRSVIVARVPKPRNLMLAALALPTSRPTTHSMLDSPSLAVAVDRLVAARRPDVVFCYCTGIAPLAFRQSLRGVPVVLDMVDVDSAKWSAMAKTTRPPLSWVYRRESRVLGRFEATAMQRAAVTLVVNERERQTLLARSPDARVEVVENGVDVESLRPQDAPSKEAVVVFVGVMDYAPNVEGAVWLAREVWPRVRQSRPDARLEIVGSSPARVVRALHDPATGIIVAGAVLDVRPYLWSAAVAAAPLHTSRGVQNKVLEAVAAGLPVVVTPSVLEGLPEAILPACVSAATSSEFADRLVSWLLKAPEQRRAVADLADVKAISWERRLAGLRQLLYERRSQSAPD